MDEYCVVPVSVCVYVRPRRIRHAGEIHRVLKRRTSSGWSWRIIQYALHRGLGNHLMCF